MEGHSGRGSSGSKCCRPEVGYVMESKRQFTRNMGPSVQRGKAREVC